MLGIGAHRGRGKLESVEVGVGEKGTPPNQVSVFSVVFEALSPAGSEPWLQTGQWTGR